MWSLIRPCGLEFFFWINRCVDTAIRATRVALELQVWHIPKFYSLKFQYFSSIWECNILILLIDLMIKNRFKIAVFSVNLGFWGSIQTLQCARAQATMLSIQCFSLDSCFDFPTWADFEECQLGSPLTYIVLWYHF